MTSHEQGRLTGSERVPLLCKVDFEVYITCRLFPVCLFNSGKGNRGTSLSYASWYRQEKYC